MTPVGQRIRQPASVMPLRYDTPTILLHWLTAILVVAQWCVGQTIDWVPKGQGRENYVGLHLTIGVLVTVVLLSRLTWRATAGRRLPPADPPFLNVIAKATHWGLYLLLAIVVALGITTAFAQGSPIFTLAHLPSFAADNRPLRQAWTGWHGTIADVLLCLAGLHATAALFHQYVLRDRLIQRLLPAGAVSRLRD